MSGSLLEPNERVLSTLNADGSRRWLDPKPVSGFFRTRRRLVGWILIAIFVTLPHIHVGGRQWFFADVAGGEFTFFGLTFLRTDTLLGALTAITIAIAIFLITAVYGRVWCGWGCPQTVYLEFVFRPIAAFFDGKGRKGLKAKVAKLPRPIRATMRWGIVALICFALANTFLSYFVGSRTVMKWSMSAPWVHPLGFGFVVFVTAAMIADFGFFREQVCFIACPYGRFQSVMLDRKSLIVGYDARRGEPRGTRKKSKKAKADIALPIAEVTNASAPPVPEEKPQEEKIGDCVACSRCVQVCPTGIDIRDGLQMECIHCARCIDACDEVMEKVGLPKGLIRYSSQEVLAGEKASFFRPRVVVYPAILAIVASVLLTMALGHADADIRFVRDKGLPYYELPTGEYTNQMRLRITNRSSEPRSYEATTQHPGFRIEAEGDDIVLEPGETTSLRLLVIADRAALQGQLGIVRFDIDVTDNAGFNATREVKFLGPMRVDPLPEQPEAQGQDNAQEGQAP